MEIKYKNTISPPTYYIFISFIFVTLISFIIAPIYVMFVGI